MTIMTEPARRPGIGCVAGQRAGGGVRRAANRRLQDRHWTRAGRQQSAALHIGTIHQRGGLVITMRKALAGGARWAGRELVCLSGARGGNVAVVMAIAKATVGIAPA